jgi:hypothetical protein
LREGGIGSTGGITISRDAIRELSAGEYGTEALLRVPWGPNAKEDGIFKMGGIGSTGSIVLSRDSIKELKGQGDDERPIKLPQVKEGGIGSTGAITISRDAIREISAGNFDAKEAIKVPWSAGADEDGIFKKGGIGSIAGIALSRGAIKELKNSNVKSEMSYDMHVSSSSYDMHVSSSSYDMHVSSSYDVSNSFSLQATSRLRCPLQAVSPSPARYQTCILLLI